MESPDSRSQGNQSIEIGDVVLNKNGRDAGTLQYVVDADDTYVSLADGRGRLLDKPKRKKRKHVNFIAKPDTRIAKAIRNREKVTNAQLRRELAQIRDSVSANSPK